MKRSIIILMAASAIAAISCTKESKDQPAAEKEQVTMSFDATIGTPTKVEIASSETEGGVTTHKLNWSVGDKIMVYADNEEGREGVEFTTDISEPSATASFEGTVDAADAYYAFYPSSAKATWNYIKRYFFVAIPENQTSVGISSMYSMAKADGNDLQFSHTTGLIKFTLLAGLHYKVAKVTFSGNDSENLAGYLKIFPEHTENNEISTDYDTYTEISLSPSEGDTFRAGTYYMMVPPESFENGITMTFIDEEGFVATKTSSNPAELKAGGILNLGGIGGQDLTFVGAYKHSLPWTEDFSSYKSANYQTLGDVSVKNNVNCISGGSTPELRIDQNASFTARIDVQNTSRYLTLTYKSYQANSDQVLSISEGAVLKDQGSIGQTRYYTIQLDDDTELLTIKFMPTKLYSYIDDISLEEGVILPQIMSFSHTGVQAMVGRSFTPPVLNGAQTAVTYSSSNPEVATVDTYSGIVTINAAGKTTITATAEASVNYFEGTASYVLEVSAAVVGYSYTFTENTFGESTYANDIRLYDANDNVVVWEFSAVPYSSTSIVTSYDETKGQGFGANANISTNVANPRGCKEITLSTDGGYGHYENKVEKIVLNVCGGGGKVEYGGLNSQYTDITVTVNGIQYGTTQTSPENPTDLTFACPEDTEPQSGEIVINWKLRRPAYGQAEIIYLKSIQIHDYQ